MPVKNEAWILEKSLTALSQFCNVIIVAEQNSTDETPLILKRFPKVVVIENTQRFLNHSVRTLLLDAARNYDGKNLMFCIDADEVPASTILDENNLKQFHDLKPGTSAILQWIQLWRSTTQYRNDDSVWSNSRKQLVFRDDRIGKYTTTNVAIDHAGRVPTRMIDKNIYIPDVPILHYQFVLFERMLAKQRWYRVVEALTTQKTAEAINNTYIITRNEKNIHRDPILPAWVDGWQELGLDLINFPSQDLFWYEEEVLGIFAEHGVQQFAKLDIWDVDWEEKRIVALAQGCQKVPTEPIKDPRSFDVKLYHQHLGKKYQTPRWYFLKNKISVKIKRVIG